MSDDFTIELRLCDDDGMVSNAPIEDVGPTLDKSYLERHNRLAHLGDWGRGERPRPDVVEPYTCTGSAHLAGEHIRCTSTAHQQRVYFDSCKHIDPLSTPCSFCGCGGPLQKYTDFWTLANTKY